VASSKMCVAENRPIEASGAGGLADQVVGIVGATKRKRRLRRAMRRDGQLMLPVLNCSRRWDDAGERVVVAQCKLQV
jgi:hypothetical protein